MYVVLYSVSVPRYSTPYTSQSPTRSIPCHTTYYISIFTTTPAYVIPKFPHFSSLSKVLEFDKIYTSQCQAASPPSSHPVPNGGLCGSQDTLETIAVRKTLWWGKSSSPRPEFASSHQPSPSTLPTQPTLGLETRSYRSPVATDPHKAPSILPQSSQKTLTVFLRSLLRLGRQPTTSRFIT